jgi:hemolysin III
MESESTDRIWSSREELSHALSHGAGAVASLVGGILLIGGALHSGSLANLIGAIIFSLSAVVLYTCSAMHHALPQGRTKDRFELFDHVAIFLLIAGTYTPFTLGVLRGPWGWTLLVLIWLLAIAGIASKFISGIGRSISSPLLYLGMGWLILIAVKPMIQRMPVPGLLLILAGGVSYSIGVGFYLARRIPYGHLVWHLFVLGGTTFHYFAIRDYAA